MGNQNTKATQGPENRNFTPVSNFYVNSTQGSDYETYTTSDQFYGGAEWDLDYNRGILGKMYAGNEGEQAFADVVRRNYQGNNVAPYFGSASFPKEFLQMEKELMNNLSPTIYAGSDQTYKIHCAQSCMSADGPLELERCRSPFANTLNPLIGAGAVCPNMGQPTPKMVAFERTLEGLGKR
jgi:hypothetical protein